MNNTSQCLKFRACFLALMVCVIACFTVSSHGQVAAEIEKGKPLATFYSAQLPIMPPLPFNPFPDLPVYEVRDGVFIYDDTKIDYVALAAKQAELIGMEASVALASAEGEDNDKGEGGSPMMMMAESGLRLLAPQIQNGSALLQIAGNDPTMPYDLYGTTNIGQSNGWTYFGRLAAGQTSISIAAPSANFMMFQLGTSQDTDGDALPDAFEMLVAQLDPATPNSAAGVPQQNPAQPFLVDVSPLVRVKTFQGDYKALLIYPGGQHKGYYAIAGWTNGIGGRADHYQYAGQLDETAFPIGMTVWDGAGSITSGGTGWDYDMPPTSQYVRYGYAVDRGANGSELYLDNVTTKLELQTGGKGLSIANHLFVLNVTAWEQQHVWNPPGNAYVGPINHSDITVLGEHPDANNQIWKTLPDNQTPDVTPSVPGQYTNYGFVVSQQKLKLKILRGETDFTDGFQTVWVGEPINLRVILEPPIATLSNFVWTIPGNSISNYVYDLNTGKVYRVYAKTNSGVDYYWIDKLTRGVVQVSAVVNGFTLNTQTTFEVLRPSASLSATITGTIALDNNFKDNVFALHFGHISGSPAGIIFDFSAPAFGTWDFGQLINNWVLRQQDPNTGQWLRSQGSGLDNVFPYGISRPPTGAFDSPGVPVIPNAAAASTSQSYTMYLMFKPPGGIFVPIRKINWGWDAAATRAGTWGSPTGTPYVDASDEDTTSHPEWTDNFIYFWLQPPVPE